MSERRSAPPRQTEGNGAETILGEHLVEAIARRVVELLSEAGRGDQYKLTDAATLASELGVERDWIYEHADELGVIRLGGPRGRLRFDRDLVRERLRERAQPEPTGRRRPHRQQASGHPPRGGLPRGAGVKSAQTQRRVGSEGPTRSPKPQQTGGNPE